MVSDASESPFIALAAMALLLLPAALLLADSPLGWPLATSALALLLLLPGLHLVAGLGGMPFLGQAGLAALGAVAARQAALAFALPAPALIVVGGLAGAASGGVLAPVLCRLPGPAHAGASLVLGLMLQPLAPASGGPPPFAAEPSGPGVYVAGAGAALAALLLAQRITGSAFGQAVRLALRQPERAAILGVEIARLRRRLLVLGAAFAGAAGALLATAPGWPHLAPPFGATSSLSLAALIVIGGEGSLAGALFAALPVLVIPELLLGLIPDLTDLRLPLAAAGVAMTLALRARTAGRPATAHALHPTP